MEQETEKKKYRLVEIGQIMQLFMYKVLDLALNCPDLPTFPTIQIGELYQNGRFDFWPSSHEDARKIVGQLRMRAGIEMTVRKYSDTGMDATGKWRGVVICVNNYRPKTCVEVEETVVIPATEEQIIEAQPERTEVRKRLVCDVPELVSQVIDSTEF